MRYFLELSYNGAAYHGWQNQPNAISVQQLTEEALYALLKRETPIVGAGRTDAGVHALQFFAHFDAEEILDPANLLYRLNVFLPNDIVILNILKVKPDAHARFDAISRTYLYRIAVKKNAFKNSTTYYLKPKLDVEAMQEASKILLQHTNFQCFSKSKTDVKTYNCKITKAEWHLTGNELQFTITADRFLRNMVRAIVGTLINIGLHKMAVSDMHTIIESKKRSAAGFSVPAQGLYLSEISYNKTLFL